MKRTLLLLSLLLATLSIDYCQAEKVKETLYLTPKQLRTIQLNSYVKGYDLVFSTDEVKEAKVFNSLDLVQWNPTYLDEESTLRSIDIKKSPHFHGLGHGAILFQSASGKQLSLWTGDVQGEETSPDFSTFRNYTLPVTVPANCWDARVISDDKDVFINCQTTPDSSEVEPQDLFCIVKETDTELQVGKNCQLLPYFMVSLQRRTRLLSLSGHLFIFSANNDVTPEDDPLSYVSVHYLNSAGKVVFANIIDGSKTSHDTLQISDIIIGKDQSIVVADAKHSRLIYYRFNVGNTYSVTKEIKLQAAPLTLGYSKHINTIMVGTAQDITQYQFGTSSVLNKYATDPSDSHINQIQFNEYLVAFRTSNSHLHVYDRNQHKITQLRRRIDMDSNTGYFLSSTPNYLFTLDFNLSSTLYAGQPFLELSHMTQNITINLLAESEEIQCHVQMKLVLLEDVEVIINKQNIATKSFKVDPQRGLTLNLDSYFGGANLRYSIPEEGYPVDFNVEVRHFKNYPFTPSFKTTEVATILHINDNQFYYIGINSVKEGVTYIDICTLLTEGLTVECQSWANITSISSKRLPVAAITAVTRSNGRSYVAWSYQDWATVQSIDITKKLISFYSHSYDFTYNSIHIGDDFMMFVSKTGRFVDISFDEQPFFADITDSFFTPEQLQEVEFFYPRSAYLPNSKSRLFYVQLPTKVAQFAILNSHKLEYRGIVASIDGYRPSNEWNYLHIDNHKVSLIDHLITQETYNPFNHQYVQAQGLREPKSASPLNYDPISGVMTLLTTPDSNGQKTVKVMRPFQGSLDFEYYQLVLDGQPTHSGNWLLNDKTQNTNPSVFYVDSNPELFATSHIPDDMFKEDVTISLNIDSKTAHETASTEIEGVNFPVYIKDHPDDHLIQLPRNATNQEVPILAETFFNGSIVDYQLECPYCYDGRIKLLTPFRHPKILPSIQNAVDFVETSQNIVTLSENVLYMLDPKLEILSIEIIPKQSCTNLEYNDAFGLFVYCTHKGQQQILQYSVDLDEFKILTAFTIPPPHAVRNFDEMFTIIVEGHSFVLILDNDEDIDSNDKQSTVKVFQILAGDLMFKDEWSSATFNPQSEDPLPINDLDIFGLEVYVTLGGYGIGYGSISSEGTVTGPASIYLAGIPDIKTVLLDDSYFKQVQVLSSDNHERFIFISSTASLSFVATFVESKSGMTYKSLDEVYLRYGNQRLLNWQYISRTHIFLSYYDEDFQQASIVYYPRQQRARSPFILAQKVRLPRQKVKYHEAFLTKNQKLLISHLSQTYGAGELVSMSVVDEFTLQLNYDKPGDFDHINIMAYNSYKNSTHKQTVEFKKPIPPPPPPPPPPPGPDGLKWYVVMIIVLVVLIISGGAYGLYRYIRAKREKKSVSLLTEREEEGDDEEKTAQKKSEDPINASEVIPISENYKSPIAEVAEEDESRDSINRD